MRILYTMSNTEYTCIGRYCVAYSIKHPEELKKDIYAKGVYELFAQDSKENEIRVSLIPEQHKALCRIVATCMRDVEMLHLADYILTHQTLPEVVLTL